MNVFARAFVAFFLLFLLFLCASPAWLGARMAWAMPASIALAAIIVIANAIYLKYNPVVPKRLLRIKKDFAGKRYFVTLWVGGGFVMILAAGYFAFYHHYPTDVAEDSPSLALAVEGLFALAVGYDLTRQLPRVSIGMIDIFLFFSAILFLQLIAMSLGAAIALYQLITG